MKKIMKKIIKKFIKTTVGGNYIVKPPYVIKDDIEIILEKDVFKIGETGRCLSVRVSEYPEDTEYIFLACTINAKKIENEIIKEFKINFKQRLDIGTEYFQGDIDKMIEIAKNIVAKIEKQEIDVIIEETEEHMDVHEKKSCATCKKIKDDKKKIKDDEKKILNDKNFIRKIYICDTCGIKPIKSKYTWLCHLKTDKHKKNACNATHVCLNCDSHFVYDSESSEYKKNFENHMENCDENIMDQINVDNSEQTINEIQSLKNDIFIKDELIEKFQQEIIILKKTIEKSDENKGDKKLIKILENANLELKEQLKESRCENKLLNNKIQQVLFDSNKEVKQILFNSKKK